MRARVLLAAAVLCAACSDRDPTNPFDPRNPHTGGRPVQLWAIPADTYVRLHWSVPDAEDIDDLTLLRIEEEGVETVRAGIPLSGTYIDPMPPSRSLRYLLEVEVVGWDGMHRSDTSVVVTSPGECWLASGYDRLTLVSPWTSPLLPFVSPGTYIVDVSGAEDILWASGMPGGIVYRINGTPSAPVVTHDIPTSLVIRSISASVATDRVLIAHAEGLTWLDADSAALDAWPFHHQAQPVLARLAPDERGAWVCFSDQTVGFLPPGGADLVRQARCPDLHDIAPAPLRRCWIGGSHGLWLIDEGGPVEISTTPCRSVAAVSSDQCWACLDDGSVALFSSGGALVRSLSLGGRLISVSPEDQTVWVASDDGWLWKLLPDFRTAARLKLAERPWAIVAGHVLER